MQLVPREEDSYMENSDYQPALGPWPGLRSLIVNDDHIRQSLDHKGRLWSTLEACAAVEDRHPNQDGMTNSQQDVNYFDTIRCLVEQQVAAGLLPFKAMLDVKRLLQIEQNVRECKGTIVDFADFKVQYETNQRKLTNAIKSLNRNQATIMGAVTAQKETIDAHSRSINSFQTELPKLADEAKAIREK